MMGDSSARGLDAAAGWEEKEETVDDTDDAGDGGDSEVEDAAAAGGGRPGSALTRTACRCG